MYGSSVSYEGDDTAGPEAGARGRVLSHTSVYAHVLWTEGRLGGQVTLHDVGDLRADLEYTITASLDDSLEVGSLVSIASAQGSYEESGTDGLIAHLASGGHLGVYASLAQDARQMVADILRRDPLLMQVTAMMDPDEADGVYHLAAAALLQDLGDF